MGLMAFVVFGWLVIGLAALWAIAAACTLMGGVFSMFHQVHRAVKDNGTWSGFIYNLTHFFVLYPLIRLHAAVVWCLQFLYYNILRHIFPPVVTISSFYELKCLSKVQDAFAAVYRWGGSKRQIDDDGILIGTLVYWLGSFLYWCSCRIMAGVAWAIVIALLGAALHFLGLTAWFEEMLRRTAELMESF